MFISEINDPEEQLREWAIIYDQSKTNEQLKIWREAIEGNLANSSWLLNLEFLGPSSLQTSFNRRPNTLAKRIQIVASFQPKDNALG